MRHFDRLKTGTFAACVVLTSLLWGATAGVSAQEEPLAWKLSAGDRFQVTSFKGVKRTAQLDSRITIVESQVKLVFDWEVVDVDDVKMATIRQTLARFEVSVGDPAVPRQSLAFASDSLPPNLTSAMRKLQRKMKPLIGFSVQFKMKPNGQMTQLQVSPESQQAIAKIEDADTLRTIIGDESADQPLAGFDKTVFPTEAQKSWIRTEDLPGTLPVEHRFAVEPASANWPGLTQIVIETVQPDAGEESPAETSPPATSAQIQQAIRSVSGKGSIRFEPKKGYFVASDYTSTVQSQRNYREKVILTTVQSTTRIEIEKQR